MCKGCVILEKSGRMIKYIPSCCKYQKVCYEAVDNYCHAWEFVPDYYKTQKQLVKLLILILLQYKLQFSVI